MLSVPLITIKTKTILPHIIPLVNSVFVGIICWGVTVSFVSEGMGEGVWIWAVHELCDIGEEALKKIIIRIAMRSTAENKICGLSLRKIPDMEDCIEN